MSPTHINKESQVSKSRNTFSFYSSAQRNLNVESHYSRKKSDNWKGNKNGSNPEIYVQSVNSVWDYKIKGKKLVN